MLSRHPARSALAFLAVLLVTCTEMPTTPGGDKGGTSTDGPPAALHVAVTALAFGDVGVGTTSPTQTVDVTNTTGAPVLMSGTGGAPGGDFNLTQNCEGTTLNPGESCQMFYTFSPTATGPATATSSGAWNGEPYSITLQGTGVTSILFRISQTALDFGQVPVGLTSRPDTVNITNITSAPIVMSGAGGAPGGPFSGAQNCQGTTLDPGETCYMVFSFTPTATGPASATSSGSWNGQAFNIALSGSGVGPRFTISAVALDFGEVPVGTTVQDTVNITNSGTAPVVMSGAGGAPGGPFSGAQNCQGTTLDPGETCYMVFSFTPTATGPASATSSGSWNGQPFNIPLTGTGIASGTSPTALFRISQTALDFGEVQVGVVSTEDTVNITNITSAPIVMSGAGGAPGGDFNAFQNCQGITLDPGETCYMVYRFSPTAAGPATSISSGSWNGQTFNIALSGTGVGPRFTISAVALDFGEVPVGTTVQDTVNITNSGTAPVVMSGAGGAPGGDFNAFQNCQGTTLDPGETCYMVYSFSPTVTGPATSTSNGSWNDRPFNIALQGTGVGPRLLITPIGFDFGGVPVGSTSDALTASITNVGPTPIVMSGIGGAPGAPFNAVQNCQGTALDPGESCQMSFTFSPTALGPASATSSGSWNELPFSIALQGTGESPYTFTGFFRPLEPFPEFHRATAGQAIPVKFSLGGDFGLDIFAAGSPASGPIECGSTTEVPGTEPTGTPGNSGLTYDAGSDRYHYVWKTERAWAHTCRQLVVTLVDGSEFRANVEFR